MEIVIGNQSCCCCGCTSFLVLSLALFFEFLLQMRVKESVKKKILDASDCNNTLVCIVSRVIPKRRVSYFCIRAEKEGTF